jgi:glycosyltransferase involved in cell wall biosynthesis
VNIVLTNHYAGSCNHGGAYRPFHLAREWVELGHRVTLVGASFSHVRTHQPEMRGSVMEEEIEGIRYVWLRTPSYQGNGARRALSMLAFVSQLWRHESVLTRDHPPDVVISSSNYPLDAVPACRIARRSNARFLVEVHDLWPLSPIELGGMSPRHPFILLMQWAENFSYRHADRVVSMLPRAADHMQKHGMARHKFAHIPNGVDVAWWNRNQDSIARPHVETVRRLKQQGRFVVGYTGAHGLANALQNLIDAAARLQTEPVTFLLVGQGPEKQALQKQAEKRGLDNVEFLPPVEKSAIPSLLAAMDALFIGWNRKPIYRFGICPNKLMDYMMAGKPILHAVEAGNDPVAEAACGSSVAPEDPVALAAAVSRLMALPPAEQAALGRRGKEYVLANHDYRTLARKFLVLMQEPVRSVECARPVSSVL